MQGNFQLPKFECIVVQGSKPDLLDLKLSGEEKENMLRCIANRLISEQQHKFYAPATTNEKNKYKNDSGILTFKDCILSQKEEYIDGYFSVGEIHDKRKLLAKQRDIDIQIFQREFGDPTPLFTIGSTFENVEDFVKKYYKKVQDQEWKHTEILRIYKNELESPFKFKQYNIQSHYCTTNYIISTTNKNSTTLTLNAASRPPCVHFIPIELMGSVYKHIRDFKLENLDSAPLL